MSDISEALLKRTSIFIIVLGAAMLIIAVAGEIGIKTFALRIASLWGQIIIGSIGFGLIGLGVYFEIKQNGNASEKSHGTGTVKAKDFFISDFPKKLETDFESAQEVWIVGITVRQFIQYVTIEQKLQKGHKIKVLLVHPDSVALSMAESFVHGRADIGERRSNSLSVLKDLCQLRKIYPKTLEIRTIDILMSHRIFAINPLSDTGFLYMHHYPYRPETNRVPKYVLSSKDGHWYSFFRQEMFNLWDSGIEWNFPSQ